MRLALVGRPSPKLVALMAWYDEPADMLYDSMLSIAPHVDYVIATDGAYPYFPGGGPESPREQHDAIRDALSTERVGWEIITPGRVWTNECEKRTYMFDYAGNRSVQGHDWFLVWDADFFMKKCSQVHERLATTGSNVATVSLHSSPASREMPYLAHRLLYRAHPRIEAGPRHNIYSIQTDHGRVYLWGHQDAVHASDLTHNMDIWHDPGRRTEERAARKDIWFEAQGRLEATA